MPADAEIACVMPPAAELGSILWRPPVCCCSEICHPPAQPPAPPLCSREQGKGQKALPAGVRETLVSLDLEKDAASTAAEINSALQEDGNKHNCGRRKSQTKFAGSSLLPRRLQLALLKWRFPTTTSQYCFILIASKYLCQTCELPICWQ